MAPGPESWRSGFPTIPKLRAPRSSCRATSVRTRGKLLLFRCLTRDCQLFNKSFGAFRGVLGAQYLATLFNRSYIESETLTVKSCHFSLFFTKRKPHPPFTPFSMFCTVLQFEASRPASCLCQLFQILAYK